MEHGTQRRDASARQDLYGQDVALVLRHDLSYRFSYCCGDVKTQKMKMGVWALVWALCIGFRLRYRCRYRLLIFRCFDSIPIIIVIVIAVFFGFLPYRTHKFFVSISQHYYIVPGTLY